MEDAVAGQYIARAQAGEHRGTPPSERGSQVFDRTLRIVTATVARKYENTTDMMWGLFLNLKITQLFVGELLI